MPEPYATSRGITLEDLLNQGGGGAAPAPLAPQATGQGDPYEAQRQALLAQLMQPDPTVPDKEAPKRNMLASILMGLGDAGTAYASVIGNAPGIKTDTLGNYMAYLTQQKDSADRFNERKKFGDAESKRRNLVIGLNEIGDKQARLAKIADDKIKAEQAKLAQNEARQYQKGLDAEKAAVDAAKTRADREWDLEREKVHFAHDEAETAIRRRIAEGDTGAKEDKKALGAIYGDISALAMTSAKNLAEGKTTPEELQQIVEGQIDSAMLSPDGRKAAELYFSKKIAPILREHLMRQQPDQAPATDPNTPAYPILQRLGSAPTPQRY